MIGNNLTVGELRHFLETCDDGSPVEFQTPTQVLEFDSFLDWPARKPVDGCGINLWLVAEVVDPYKPLSAGNPFVTVPGDDPRNLPSCDKGDG